MLRYFTLLGGLCFFWGIAIAQNEQTLHHLASFETGMEAAAETVAFDPASNRVFLTNSAPNTLGIVDISDLKAPALVMEISLSPYGAGPNSVAASNGVVAVAVQSDPKTDPGKVVFFDSDGNYLHEVTVGALPDMLTFSQDGALVLVANEGEPDDDYTVDPMGSVSVIDLSGGVSSAAVTTITFEAYNDRKANLQNKGVRIFGNDGLATVAEDLEPEYIALSPDGAYAYVNCQESNALAVLDMATLEFVDILPLGYKNHQTGRPVLESFIVNELAADWPELGTPVYDGGQDPVFLGGFSGMYYDPTESTVNKYVFYVVPDRGPNDDTFGRNDVSPAAPQNLRPFKLPDYQGRIVKLSLNRQTGAISLDEQVLLYRQDGATPISGKGNIPGFDEVPVTYTDPSTPYANVDYTDNASGEELHQLPYDELGGDFEGILRDKDGNFWMCDEYRPALYKFQPDGVLIERYVPEGTSQLGTTPQPAGTYGAETLPAVYSKRRANRGFEAIAYDPETNVVYAFIQSPLENPDNSVRNNTDVIRILGVDAASGTPVEEYVYLLEQNQYSGLSTSRVDKIGDAVYAGDGKFLVLERDSEAPGVKEGKKFIFEITLAGATNTLELPNGLLNLEEYSADELLAAGIQAVHKTKVANLPTLNYVSSDKAEGLAFLPGGEIAVINDNDFGLAGAGVTDNSVLGIISFQGDYGFDASDRDSRINITSHPTLGMFMPDAIAAYEADGKAYVVTANEGDSRDYDGYSEEVRVKDLTLDPAAYPNAAELQADENLGRLKTTTANGDYDGDGDVDQIYSFGGRSFSIFDAYGNLVYDSGQDFGTIASFIEPGLFNEDEGEKDGRSDDKGVEPEALAIGTIGGYTYAFVGFERQNAIVAYDITDPFSPMFITYYNNRTLGADGIKGDVSPEIIKFVPAVDSPNGENLLVVGYEVSGSVGIIQVGGELVSISEELRDATAFRAFPNPAVDRIFFNQPISGQVFDANGRLVTTMQNVAEMNVNGWPAGLYLIATEGHGRQRFLKL
ncbi:MAG: esterase-like activity of phytase family protein [Lewinellaceae bacterium]|nr:esterase-like activity of phytase family protein [Phaeodactylibacter sp.]MCB9036982.1 esterase-like activity of phytase family protein [Lewinellaceae bacterium]